MIQSGFGLGAFLLIVVLPVVSVMVAVAWGVIHLLLLI